MSLIYGFHPTRYGQCFIAAADSGICALAFVDQQNSGEVLRGISQQWPKAKMVRDQQGTRKYVGAIFGRTTSGAARPSVHLLVKATDFQIKVWQALLQIPAGTRTTYQSIARQIHRPRAVRAVGNAVGQNPVAYVIPCHRVIRSDGQLGGYRWGAGRKQAMLDAEVI